MTLRLSLPVTSRGTLALLIFPPYSLVRNVATTPALNVGGELAEDLGPVPRGQLLGERRADDGGEADFSGGSSNGAARRVVSGVGASQQEAAGGSRRAREAAGVYYTAERSAGRGGRDHDDVPP